LLMGAPYLLRGGQTAGDEAERWGQEVGTALVQVNKEAVGPGSSCKKWSPLS
jgi:hypothetical protein